ncbi:hypothetical protein X777_13352 [Ooceraea biroi]|uniref:Uncharacterized protein n=1 Tax=Ooceraea biroi TaxID=2015173 RepID=A0A026WWQ9_OOCBI|nr:hypothetical protein X777_13352 [Ooceraea biroi]
MFNHAGPPQIWGFPGIGPSNDRGDTKACNHVRGQQWLRATWNRFEERSRKPVNSITQPSLDPSIDQGDHPAPGSPSQGISR